MSCVRLVVRLRSWPIVKIVDIRRAAYQLGLLESAPGLTIFRKELPRQPSLGDPMTQKPLAEMHRPGPAHGKNHQAWKKGSSRRYHKPIEE